MAELVIKLVNGELAGKSIQSLNKDLAAATLAYKKAAIGTQEWIDAGKKVEEIKNLQQDLKKQIDQTASASDQLKKAWNNLPGAQYFNKVVDSFGMMKSGVGGLISQFGVLKGAIAATGIGLLVVAFATLVAWFQKTDEGATLLSGIMKGLGIVFDKVFGGLIDLFKNLKGYFTGEKSIKQGITDLIEWIGNNLLNRVKAFGVAFDAISKLMHGNFKDGLKQLADSVIQFNTGITDGTDKIASFGKAIGYAVQEGIDFEKQLDAIEDRARELSVLNAETEKEVGKLLLQSKNVGLTYKERIALLDQASAIELKNHEEQLKNAKALEDFRKREIENNKARNIQNDELDQSLADATIARINLEKESITLQEKIANRRTALMEKEEADERKHAEELQKAFDAWLAARNKAWDEYYANQNSLDEMNIDAMAEGRDKDLANLKLSLKQQIEALDVNAPFYAERLAAAQALARKKASEINTKWDKTDLDNQIKAIDLSTATELNGLNQLHLDGLLSQRDYVKKTQELAIAGEERKLALIEAAHGIESKEYQDQYAKILGLQKAANDSFKKEAESLTKALAQSVTGTLSVFANLFGSLASLFEEGTQQYKDFATAQAIISTIQGAVNAYTSALAIPYIGEVLAPIAAAAALASGYAQVKKIQDTPVKSAVRAETGGLLVGKRHSQGGIDVNAEDGEFIFSRKAVENIGVDNLLNMNDHFSRKMQAGGPVNPFHDRAPVKSAAATNGMSSSSDDRIANLESAFKNYAQKVDTWATNLTVKNVAYTSDRKGYQDQLDIINKIKDEADV